MNIDTSHPLTLGRWFPELTPKKHIVWHGTAARTIHTPIRNVPGQATTTIDLWNLAVGRNGAPWLVDRDGTIYKTFEDSGWNYHLGLGGTHARYDRDSVAIEFASELTLDLDGDRLYAFGMPATNALYIGPYLTHDWRGSRYHAQLDEPQVDAGIELTLDICRRHDIEPSFYYPSTTFDFPRCFRVATIVCHSNCRADMTDLCLPEWVFEKIEAAGIRLVS
jgi:N-acetylmuramoyl-L-alanine amidase-like protein